jgi:signal peptidase I
MDFSFILFLLVCATGLIWALDHLIWAPRRRRGAPAAKEPVYVEYARAFFPVILIVFLLRSFLVEPFRIPSGSMLPSLYIGDFILVNKFSFGIRLPVINRKVVDLADPKRGDVVVFRFPHDPSINYIKRVVGVPGDRVVYKGKALYINGKAMEQSDVRPYASSTLGDLYGEVVRATEELDGTKHDILKMDRPDPDAVERVVPAGHYFVMGDNRDQSNDSRFWGFVPDENLVGRAFLIWFSWDLADRSDKWFWQRILWERIGNTIH